MANDIGGLFKKYSGTYSTAQGSTAQGDVGREVLDAKGQRKTSRHELRGFDAGVPRISKRGGNFLDRVVCWLEDRVFSLTRSGSRLSPRQKSSNQFAADVAEALREIDPDLVAEGGGGEKHDLVRRIESVQVRDLPLRSGFVRGILQEVATLARRAEHGDKLPDLAKNAFPVQDGRLGQPAVHPEVGAQDNREAEEVIHQNLPLPHALGGRGNRQEGGEDVARPDGSAEPHQGVQIQPVADQVEEPFSFADLNDEQLLGRLREPVKSKMIIPVLRERGLWAAGAGDEQEREQIADRIVDDVANAVVAAGKGGLEQLKLDADGSLGLLRTVASSGREVVVTDRQLQNRALKAVVEQHIGRLSAVRSVEIVTEIIDRHLRGRPDGLSMENHGQEVVDDEWLAVPGEQAKAVHTAQ